jgi:hypothetical protein
MLADMTTLRNRMIVIAFTNTPNIASTFAGPKVADLFNADPNLKYPWAFGAWTIITVGVCIPVAVVLLIFQRKAEKQGVLEKEKSGRTFFQSIWYYTVQFDGASPEKTEPFRYSRH